MLGWRFRTTGVFPWPFLTLIGDIFKMLATFGPPLAICRSFYEKVRIASAVIFIKSRRTFTRITFA